MFHSSLNLASLLSNLPPRATLHSLVNRSFTSKRGRVSALHTMATSGDPSLSPGNAFSLSNMPAQMRLPHLDFIYRLECEMAQEDHDVGAAFSGSHSRIIMPIVRGTVNGPRIRGTIQHMRGADWGTTIKGTDVRALATTDNRSNGTLLNSPVHAS